MEVREAIDDLRSSLEHITAEDELLAVIDVRVPGLRQSYPSHRPLFTPTDIAFLKSLGPVSDHLRAFLELKEELADLNSLEEYEDIVRRLIRVKRGLACFPVAARIAKELRELNERLPAIRQQDEDRRQFRRNARILDLQQNPRRCACSHSMVIREGKRGYFWGCSRYPFCTATKRLTPEEDRLLNT